MEKECPIKAGQYFAAAYNGNNGDLILGRVQSVRVNGSVILDNLLTGNTSTKKTKVLRRRNKRISKKEADRLLALHKGGATRQDVRKAAVETPAVGAKKPPQQTLEFKMLVKAVDFKSEIRELANKFVEDVIKLVESK